MKAKSQIAKVVEGVPPKPKKEPRQKKQKAERVNFDVYQTPSSLARAIVGRLKNSILDYNEAPRLVVEPSCGDGRFVAAAREAWPATKIRAWDIRAEVGPTVLAAGADEFNGTDWLNSGRFEADVILGNPPFGMTEIHVGYSLEHLKRGGWLLFLLRMSILGGLARARGLWSQRGLRFLVPVVPRPSFVGESTDSAEYAVFCWQRGYAGLSQIQPHLFWKADGNEEKQTTIFDAISGGQRES